jgi:hypothetical protein
MMATTRVENVARAKVQKARAEDTQENEIACSSRQLFTLSNLVNAGLRVLDPINPRSVKTRAGYVDRVRAYHVNGDH